MKNPSVLEALGIKIGPPLSRRQEREIDKLYAEWHKEIGAYMKAHGVGYDEAFVACGGMIIETTLSPPGRVR